MIFRSYRFSEIAFLGNLLLGWEIEKFKTLIRPIYYKGKDIFGVIKDANI